MYDEVASGNEIRSVVLAGRLVEINYPKNLIMTSHFIIFPRRLDEFPMGKIDGTIAWQVIKIMLIPFIYFHTYIHTYIHTLN